MTQIKYCGIKKLETIEGLNTFSDEDLKYIGFVLAPSKRQVTFERLNELTEALAPRFLKVGVFVNPSTAELEKALTAGIQILQFHGDETENRIQQQVKAIYGRAKPREIQIWKALRVGSKDSLHLLVEEDLLIDKYLIDKLDTSVYGGTGKAFDWRKLHRIPFENRRVVVAGGIDDGNVKTLLNYYQPSVIDLSSSIETKGEKDLKKMESFLKAFHETSGIQSQTML